MDLLLNYQTSKSAVISVSNYTFPKNFMWGGAFSANQTEGAFNLGGKGLSVADVAQYKPNLNVENFTAHNFVSEKLADFAIENSETDALFPKRRGNQFYSHFKEDIGLMHEMSSNAMRISIAWTRIYPTGNEMVPNEEGLKYYDSVFDAMIEKGIEPIVTLAHYEMPLHLARYEKGWANRTVIEKYLRYCETLFNRYKDKVKYWIGINEIDSIFRHPFTSGGILVDQYASEDTQKIITQALHYQFVASSLATKLCHEIIPESKMGSMLTKLTFYPHTCHPKDVLKAQKINRLNMMPTDIMHRGYYPQYVLRYIDKYELDVTKEDLSLIATYKPDFLSLSYYMSMTASDDPTLTKTTGNTITGVKNPYIETSEWGWQIDPQGLRYSLIELYDRYQVPLLIVENGLGAKDDITANFEISDKYRSDYHIAHLKELSNAINKDGVDCFGYVMWSPVDSVSASTSQISKRYGFVYVDADDEGNGTYNRYKKDSFDIMKEIYSTNGNALNNL